jgi:hypothetical protein
MFVCLSSYFLFSIFLRFFNFIFKIIFKIIFGRTCYGTTVVGQDHGDSKSNRLHVDIFRFCFIHLRHILV